MKTDLCVNADYSWYTLDGEMKKRSENGGLYRVHAGISANGFDFKSVPRLLAPDPYGRLYIGKADIFTDRFIQLLIALNPSMRSQSHGFGIRYNAVSKFVEHYPLDNLFFSLRFSPDPRSAEAQELEEYRQEFGELPPFNANS